MRATSVAAGSSPARSPAGEAIAAKIPPPARARAGDPRRAPVQARRTSRAACDDDDGRWNGGEYLRIPVSVYNLHVLHALLPTLLAVHYCVACQSVLTLCCCFPVQDWDPVVLERLPFRLALHPDRLQKCNGRSLQRRPRPASTPEDEAQRLDGGQDDHSSFEVSLLASCSLVVFSTCA